MGRCIRQRMLEETGGRYGWQLNSDGSYLCVCRACGHCWRSSLESLPRTCANPKCQVKAWSYPSRAERLAAAESFRRSWFDYLRVLRHTQQ